MKLISNDKGWILKQYEDRKVKKKEINLIAFNSF